MVRHCRLTHPAIVDGAPRRPGYNFALEDGDVGPSVTVIINHVTGATEVRPLYVEVPEPEPEPEDAEDRKLTLLQRVFTRLG